MAFKKGSLTAKIALTRNVDLAVAASHLVLEAINTLSTPRKPTQRALTQESGTARILNRLDKLALVHERSKADAKLALSIPKAFRTDLAPQAKKTATFGGAATKRLAEMREPVFSEANVTLYGRLVELVDKSQIEREGGKFWGELRRDNGERWRVQFDDRDQALAVPLFRKQVEVKGEAFYYQTRSPKLVASSVERDDPRDYVAAFEELFAADKDHLGDFTKLIEQRYE